MARHYTNSKADHLSYLTGTILQSMVFHPIPRTSQSRANHWDSRQQFSYLAEPLQTLMKQQLGGRNKLFSQRILEDALYVVEGVLENALHVGEGDLEHPTDVDHRILEHALPVGERVLHVRGLPSGWTATH